MGFVDLSLEIHGFVKDAGDLQGLVAEAVEKNVLAASETPATCGEIIPRFAAGKVWIGHNLFSRANEKPEIGESLFRSPHFFSCISVSKEYRGRHSWISGISFSRRLGFRPESLFGNLLECPRGKLTAIQGVET